MCKIFDINYELFNTFIEEEKQEFFNEHNIMITPLNGT